MCRNISLEVTAKKDSYFNSERQAKMLSLMYLLLMMRVLST